MQHLSELPAISSIGIEDDIIELELEAELEKLPDRGDEDPVVLVARYAGQITVTVGEVLEQETIDVNMGMETWTRIKIKGSSVTFTIK